MRVCEDVAWFPVALGQALWLGIEIVELEPAVSAPGELKEG